MNRCSAILTKLSSYCCLLLILLTVEQVVARYLFSSSSKAIQELEWHLFGAMFLLSSAAAFRRNEHVRVDIVYANLSNRLQALVNCLGIIFFLVPSCLIIIIYGWHYTLRARQYPSQVTETHYCSYYFPEESRTFTLCATIERPLRKSVLIGERSADPGGLEARWIIKALIPFSFLMILLQACCMLPALIHTIFIPDNPGKEAHE